MEQGGAPVVLFHLVHWRGEPLRDYETVVRLIAGNDEAKGLKVTCRLDHRKYPVGEGSQMKSFAHVNLKPTLLTANGTT